MASKLEILAYENSSLGTLCLRRRELLKQPGSFVTEVTLNHEFLMSSLYTDSERELARIAIEMHGATELNVLIGGLGLGYTAAAALASNAVGHVEVAELIPEVIAWMQQGLVPLSERLNSDDRLQLTCCDVYRRLCGPPESKFDVIMIDVDHSPDERLDEHSDDFSQLFYTQRGLRLARQHLHPGGVLAVWSCAQSSSLGEAMRDVFDEMTVQDVSYQNDLIDQQCTDWLYFAR